MKKVIILMFCLVAITLTTNANTYFVDTSKGTNGGGTSFTDAFNTIAAAEAAAVNTGDNIYIKGGLTISSAAVWNLKAVNYYGGFAGTETSPSQRQMNDNDGNGITESWEFKYPTVFSSTYTAGNAIVLLASTTLDGFTISNTATKTNNNTTSFTNPIGGIVQNCVFSGSNLNYTCSTNTSTSSPGGCLIKNLGDFKDCLIEKNIVTISFATGAGDKNFAPIFEFNFGAVNFTPTLSRCVFRNNTANISSNTTATFTGGGIRGLIVNVIDQNGNTSAVQSATISDCLIYNNEIAYTNNGGTVATLPYASILSSYSFSTSVGTNVWLNNTIANNKMTNCSKAFFVYPNGSIAHKIYNNVFWNNQNTVSSTSITSAVSMTSGSAQGANTIVSNNIMDVATNGNWGTAFVFNQINLSTTNTTASTGPQFANPTLIVGNSTGGTVETADWRLGLGSYLAGKGTVPTSPIDAITTDKAGITFLNPRAVGAYEFVKVTPVITWSQTLTGLNSNVTLSATSTSDATYGAPIVYTPADPTIVTVTGNTMTLVATGSTTVTASQAANTFYNAAVPVTLNVSVNNVSTALNPALIERSVFTPTTDGIISEINAQVQVFSFSGKLIKMETVTSGQTIKLSTGVYILKAKTEKGNLVQKVVL